MLVSYSSFAAQFENYCISCTVQCFGQCANHGIFSRIFLLSEAFFCPHLAWKEKSFFTNYLRLAKAMAWWEGCFFLFILRREDDVLTR